MTVLLSLFGRRNGSRSSVSSAANVAPSIARRRSQRRINTIVDHIGRMEDRG